MRRLPASTALVASLLLACAKDEGPPPPQPPPLAPEHTVPRPSAMPTAPPSSAPAATASARPPHVHLEESYSAEAAYETIVVDDASITYTTYDAAKRDAAARPQSPIAQVPEWTAADLDTRKAQLSESEVDDLVHTLDASGFLSLAPTYGDAGAGERYYARTIVAQLGERKATVVFRSTARPEPRPAPFDAVDAKLHALVKAKF